MQYPKINRIAPIASKTLKAGNDMMGIAAEVLMISTHPQDATLFLLTLNQKTIIAKSYDRTEVEKWFYNYEA